MNTNMNSLARIFADLNYYQFVARDEWILNDVKKPYEGGNPMPTFLDYDKTWTDAGFDNPFVKAWTVHDVIDHDYLNLVIKTLEEQLLWYCVDYEWVRADSNVRGETTSVLDYFCGFLDAVFRLKIFTSTTVI